MQQACATLNVDVISLDLTQRPEKYFKFTMLGTAIARGIKIELCYSQGLLSDNPNAKRMVISNATQLIRVTRGRGLIFSSEARNVLGVRAPSDVINLASIWGLGHERGKDGVTKEARSVVEFARLKRTSYNGIVDVIYGGTKPPAEEAPKGQNQQNKRKRDNVQGAPVKQPSAEKSISKRQMKRDKKAKLEGDS